MNRDRLRYRTEKFGLPGNGRRKDQSFGPRLPGRRRPVQVMSSLFPRRARVVARGIVALLLGACASEQGSLVDSLGDSLHGSTRTRYRARRTSGSADHDAYSIVSLSAGDPAQDDVSVSVLGRVWADLGGHGSDDVFRGLDDTSSGSVDGLLYSGYVEAAKDLAVERVRLGRQRVLETPEIAVFDGLLVDALPVRGIRYGGYAGRRAQYYESPGDDLVAGVYGEARPWGAGRVRLDYMLLEDEERLGEGQDDLLGLEVVHFAGPELALQADFSALEGDGRDLELSADWLGTESVTAVRARYYELLRTQRERALEVDPFSEALLEYHPFRELGLSVSRETAGGHALTAAADVRRLADSGDESELNHEFEHYTLSTVFRDVLAAGLELTLSGDVWRDDQQDVRTWGADVTHRGHERLEASIGSYFSLYKYDLFQASERDDVRTFYARTEWEQTDDMSFDLSLEYDDDDIDDFARLTLGVRWRF